MNYLPKSVHSLIFLFLIVFIGCGKQEQESQVSKNDPRLMAFSYLNEGNYDEAEIAFRKAIKTVPNDILNYIDLGLLYAGESNYEEAEKIIAKGLEIQPENISLKLTLSEIFLKIGDKNKAKEVLAGILRRNEENIQALYMQAGIARTEGDTAIEKKSLLKIIENRPANILARFELIQLFSREDASIPALFFLQSVKKIVPSFSLEMSKAYDEAASLLKSGKGTDAKDKINRFYQLMQTTRAYIDSYSELAPPRLPSNNFEFYDSRFSQYDSQIVVKNHVTLDDIRFFDATQIVGLDIPDISDSKQAVLAMADEDGTGSSYVYVSFSGNSTKHFLFKRDSGDFTDITSSWPFSHEGQEYDAAFADYDNDGYQDLLILTSKGIIIYRNLGDGTFAKDKNTSGLNKISTGRKLLIADFDQDADLDIYVACTSTNQFFRNNGDGTFTEQAKLMNLVGSAIGNRDVCFGDWDSDGDMDIATISADGSFQLFDNLRRSRFANITESLNFKGTHIVGEAITMGDYNNDGKTDILIANSRAGGFYLLEHIDGQAFSVKNFSFQKKGMIDKVNALSFIDFDNDGFKDVIVCGSGKEAVFLFHNEEGKNFRDVSAKLLPQTIKEGFTVELADFNLDGDDDIFLSGASGLYLLRNDGGNQNHYMQVQLRGLSYGNNKNNRFGIGAQVELKAGDLYQIKTITRALTNFGVGDRDSLEAVRIIWPNGDPEYVRDPSSKQKFIEQERLKGSCPFLFTWNGKEYEFIKDMMWRSALGMPLTVSSKGDTTFAFSDASQEYLLIPGEKLKPKQGKYSIKITEELWEAVYFDKAALIAVDHPDSIDVYVDERFVLPPFPGKEIYKVGKKFKPINAYDDKGNDISSKISAYDFDYISSIEPGRFQGLTEDHDLVLDLGHKAIGDSLYLFLRGWVFPTDASINASLTQSNRHKQKFPSLQVLNKKGEWQTVIPNIGYPMGKDKMVIVNLTGKFLTPENRQVRIRTNMQVYWDEIFFTKNSAKAPVKMSDLKMLSANLSFRGYSASYTKGGPFGPHWFNYYAVTKGQRWRDLTGHYTRFGDVLPLLARADDEYIIANSGDEISIDFDANNLPGLPKGWKRDFLIYSEGWVKDGDLNTAHGQTVSPLPFHKMPSYPYEGKAVYPSDERLKAYHKKYNTRVISTEEFKSALKARDIQ